MQIGHAFMIKIGDITLSDEAVRECETCPAAEFAREWKNGLEAKGNENLIVPVFFRREVAAEFVNEKGGEVPITCLLTKNKPTEP